MIFICILFTCLSTANALDNETSTFIAETTLDELQASFNDEELKSDEIDVDSSSELIDKIASTTNGNTIILEKGTYKINNVLIDKNLTFQGNGDPREVIIDAENKSSIFLIRNDAVHVSFKNITFINANTMGFGGAISMETGHVYVDNCHFINNTASVNAGGISNYGTEDNKGYLFVNNSLFVNNYAGHDGGAVTTCYANSDIYNCVFIGNSAHRDGGAIRVSVQGYGNVQDCIFMYNHADEWGGAYYSWSGTSNIERCIFMNNTAGTNGGAVMVSGDINLENSIIMNNYGGETGGSFYIQQPMYNSRTVINVHDNLITNNSSPYGKEIYINWKNTEHLYTKFNNNDWGDEDPNDPSVIDPDKITSRSKVTSTIKSNLLNILSLGLLTQYGDIIGSYFPDDYLDNINKQSDTNDENNDKHAENNLKHQNSEEIQTSKDMNKQKTNQNSDENNIITDNSDEKKDASSKTDFPKSKSETNNDNQNIIGNSTTHGENDKAYELNEKTNSVLKQSSFDIKHFILGLMIVFVLLAIGYTKKKNESK